jgi:DNA topoisomerase VI subunit A
MCKKIVMRKTQKNDYSNRFASWQLGEKEKKRNENFSRNRAHLLTPIVASLLVDERI